MAANGGMAHRRGHPGQIRPGGFTLIELLLSVTLLVLIVLVSGYIFDSTVRAVGETQACTEMNVSLQAFAKTMREDFRGIECGGWLFCGQRIQAAYGSLRDRTNARLKPFRTDWVGLTTNTEQYSAMDSRVIGQSSRILYGHGLTTDPRGNHGVYSNIATDWVVMRHQVVQLPQIKPDFVAIHSAPFYGYGWDRAFSDVEDAEGYVAYYPSGSGSDYYWVYPFERNFESYYKRDFRWSWSWVYRGNPILNISEPDNYFDYLKGSYQISSPRYALPHCAEFQVQYAMAEDLPSADDGAIHWRDPPRARRSDNPPDPNYDPADLLHRNQRNSDGRLLFGPGDRWPVLLKVTAEIFDPIDRLEGGRKMVLVVPLP